MTEEIQERTDEEKRDFINQHANVVLEGLFKEYEGIAPEGDKGLTFIGDMYARLVFSAVLGFNPEALAKNANEAADNILSMLEQAGSKDD